MENNTKDHFIDGAAGRLSVRTKGLTKSAIPVVLVQGANLSGQAAFDFQLCEHRDYSLMDALLARDIPSVTFAVRGYAQSDAPEDPLTVDTDAAIEDLITVLGWLDSEGYSTPHLLGWSWGGRIVARYTELHRDDVARLVLLDPALGGGDRIPFDPEEPWWTGGWDYFHDREPEYAEADFRGALADYVVAHEPRSPNGIRLENARGSTPANPARIERPTLMIYGSAAGRQDYMQGVMKRTDFFEKLSTTDKSLVIVPDGGDYAHLQRPRHRIQKTIANFLLAD